MRMRYSNPPDVEARLTAGPPNRRRRRQGGNIMIMFTMMLPFVLIPLVGLAIDATMLYSVKAKLQAAVDGGVLAAAQSLSAGLPTTAQQSAAELAADEFISANIHASPLISGGFWGANNLNDVNCITDAHGDLVPTGGGATVQAAGYGTATTCMSVVQDPNSAQRNVSVVAGVRVPLLFMRILGFSNGSVTSRGTASRRDVVLEFVIDRSSSMTGTLDVLKPAAQTFVQGFTAGRDHLGLVVFGGSAIVAYPLGDWLKNTPTGATGPDTHFRDTPDTTQAPNMVDAIGDIAIGTNTNTAEGLTLAYKELQATNLPGALNVIVLFTDGQPNGITANFNSSTGVGNGTNHYGTAGPVVNSTSCKNYSVAPNAGLPATVGSSMLGWFAQWNDYVGAVNYPKYDTSVNGIWSLAQFDKTTNTSVVAWLQNGSEARVSASLTTSPGYNCDYQTNTNLVMNDLTQIPAADYWGDSTIGLNNVSAGVGVGAGTYTYSDYKQSSIWNGTTAFPMCNKDANLGGVPLILKGNIPHSNPTATYQSNSCQIGLASWNAADMAAYTIHQDAAGLRPMVYALGFEGNGGDDPAFMRRLANLNGSSTVYNPGQPQGMYIQVTAQADIGPALQSVLAEILRLSM